MNQEQHHQEQAQRSLWPPARKQLLWAGIALGLAFLIIVIYGGYSLGWKWTGLPQAKVPEETAPTKTLWDWLDLLIVTVVLAVGGYLFTRSENIRRDTAAEQQRVLDQRLADERVVHEQALAEKRRLDDKHLAEQRRLDDTLRDYIDEMANCYWTSSWEKLRQVKRLVP